MRERVPCRNAGTSPRFSVRGRLLAAVAAALLLASCSPGGPGPGAGATSGATPAPPATASPATGSGQAALPATVFTDAELVALLNGVAQSRNLPGPVAMDSARQRSAAGGGALPTIDVEVSPRECRPLVPVDPFSRWADTAINFGEGATPLEAQSGPLTTIMVTLRSAASDVLAAADFGYTQETMNRCGTFKVSATESGRTSTQTMQLLDAPQLGDKQHALMQIATPAGPGDYGTVTLQVMAGTLSISMSRAVATLRSEADAQPALDSMAELARELIGRAVKSPPSVGAAPSNPLPPERMAAALKGVTGPHGEPVSLQGATVIGPPPGSSASPAPQETQQVPPSCAFDDEAYYSSLSGSVLVQGQIEGASKLEYSDFAVISMPADAVPPYPFDTRAASLSRCTAIEETMMGGPGRPWREFSQVNSPLKGDSRYAVSYQLSDGTGEWHVRSGARKGSVSVEVAGRARSQDGIKQLAESQASFVTTILARTASP